jgi:hypothetical protein
VAKGQSAQPDPLHWRPLADAEFDEVAEANGFLGRRFEVDSRRGIEIQRKGLFV